MILGVGRSRITPHWRVTWYFVAVDLCACPPPELDIVTPTAKTREFEAKGIFQPANLCRAVLMRNQYVPRLDDCLWGPEFPLVVLGLLGPESGAGCGKADGVACVSCGCAG